LSRRVLEGVYRLSSKNQPLMGSSLPGPTTLPFLGHVLGIEPNKPWVTYTEHGAVDDDIYTTRLLHRDIVIVNSKKITGDLMDHRSQNCSDRMPFATRDPYI
ncbi:hypothetical protein BV22DRAFT_1020691, partial [Leucogyrophana mollusca]